MFCNVFSGEPSLKAFQKASSERAHRGKENQYRKTHTQTHTHIHIHTDTATYTHTHTHTQTHTYTHTHTHAHTHIWLVELSREKQLNCNAIPYPSCKQNENIALHVCSFHLRSALIFPLSECRGSFSPAGITVLLRSVTGTFYIVLMAKAPQINEGCKFNQLPFCLGV